MIYQDKKKEIVLEKVDYFYDQLRDKLIDRAYYFCNALLLKTAEREYKLNDQLVSKEEFFKDNKESECYFKNGTYIPKGLNTYRQRYRYTLTPQEAIEQFASTLDKNSQLIMQDITPEDVFIKWKWYGYTDMPDQEWHQDDDWED